MNEQMLEQQSEEVLTLEVSDEALEAAGGNEFGLGITFGNVFINFCTIHPRDVTRC